MSDAAKELKNGPEVIWIDSDTGEIKCRRFQGRDPVIWSKHAPDNPTGEPQFRGEFDEWEMTGLEMALGWVPDLAAVMDKALAEGRSLELCVKLRNDGPERNGG